VTRKKKEAAENFSLVLVSSSLKRRKRNGANPGNIQAGGLWHSVGLGNLSLWSFL
jgi:hypothetical protein